MVATQPMREHERLPEGDGPPERAARWSWVVLGVVIALLLAGMGWVGWLVGGLLGVEIVIALTVIGAAVRMLPVMPAAWFRRRDQSKHEQTLKR